MYTSCILGRLRGFKGATKADRAGPQKTNRTVEDEQMIVDDVGNHYHFSLLGADGFSFRFVHDNIQLYRCFKIINAMDIACGHLNIIIRGA